MIYLWYLFGCLFCCPLPADCIMTTHFTEISVERIKTGLRENGREGCLVNFLLWIAQVQHNNSKRLFDHLKARGNTVMLWVVNTAEELNLLRTQFGNSVDGVMTDRPSLLKTWTQNRTEHSALRTSIQKNEVAYPPNEELLEKQIVEE